MLSTGLMFPRSASTLSESGWTGNTWLTPENLYGAGDAAITAATFDAGVHSRVLRGYAFDCSTITDGSSINGVRVTWGGAYYGTAVCALSMSRLLTDTGSQVGTDQYSSPVNLTTSPADYTIGGSGDTWGNTLTSSWVKSTLFGVALGVIVGASNNCDVFVNSLSMEIWYTPPAATNYTRYPADSQGLSDSVSRSVGNVRYVVS